MTGRSPRIAACCLALGACQAPAEAAKPKETTMAQENPPQNPFEGVFPPAWKVGTRWRVAMKTEYDGPPLMAPAGPMFEELEFAFRVVAMPEGDDGVYRLDVECKPSRLHYYATYRAKTFSFVRLEDEAGKSVSMVDETNPPIPYLGGVWGRFIKDFPAMPTVPRTGIVPFVFNKEPATQDVERTADGLRFTLTRATLRVVIDWKRGAPWWSSLERVAFQFPGIPGPPQFLASGKLLGP